MIKGGSLRRPEWRGGQCLSVHPRRCTSTRTCLLSGPTRHQRGGLGTQPVRSPGRLGGYAFGQEGCRASFRTTGSEPGGKAKVSLEGTRLTEGGGRGALSPEGRSPPRPVCLRGWVKSRTFWSGPGTNGLHWATGTSEVRLQYRKHHKTGSWTVVVGGRRTGKGVTGSDPPDRLRYTNTRPTPPPGRPFGGRSEEVRCRPTPPGGPRKLFLHFLCNFSTPESKITETTPGHGSEMLGLQGGRSAPDPTVSDTGPTGPVVGELEFKSPSGRYRPSSV